MAFISKRIKKARELFDAESKHSLDEAIKIIGKYKEFAQAKFDESIDIAIKLNLDPKQADQMLRGAITMPNGLGKNIKVAVIARPDLLNQAGDADICGSDELIESIRVSGKIDCDVIIASADMMPKLAKIGKILGPIGLMPNIKLGTVTDDIAQAVKNAKSGQVEYKVEKNGIVHATTGKISFEFEALKQNILALYKAIINAKPSGAKGIYVQSFWLSSTMGPSIMLDLDKIVS